MIDQIMDVCLRFDDRAVGYLNRVLSMPDSGAMLEVLRSLSKGKADLNAGTLPSQERDICVVVPSKQRHYFRFALENGRAPSNEEIMQMRHDGKAVARMARGLRHARERVAPLLSRRMPQVRIH